jgi:L-alanine-DL-glutamate epimerase-like enolase superfamily enzyme
MRLRIREIAPIAVRIPPDDSGPKSSWTAEVGQQILVLMRDADGTMGWGGCFAYRSPRCVFEAVNDLAPLILERDFIDAAEVSSTLEAAILTRPREARWAAAGIELAAWDLLGKQRGVAVSELLRKPELPLRSHIPVYSSLPRYESDDDVVLASAASVRQGFTAIKLHQVDVNSVAAARAAVGPHIQLMLDVNCAWSLQEAIVMCRELEPYGLRWLEEPVAPPDDYEGLSRVRQHSRVPIACGENALTAADFRGAIEVRAADIYQPSLLKVGGLTPMRKIVAQITATKCELVPHSYYFGPGLAASIHLAANCDVITTLEIPFAILQADILRVPLKFDSGVIHVPTAPGLGADPELTTLERYQIDTEELGD